MRTLTNNTNNERINEIESNIFTSENNETTKRNFSGEVNMV